MSMKEHGSSSGGERNGVGALEVAFTSADVILEDAATKGDARDVDWTLEATDLVCVFKRHVRARQPSSNDNIVMKPTLRQRMDRRPK